MSGQAGAEGGTHRRVQEGKDCKERIFTESTCLPPFPQQAGGGEVPQQDLWDIPDVQFPWWEER